MASQDMEFRLDIFESEYQKGAVDRKRGFGSVRVQTNRTNRTAVWNLKRTAVGKEFEVVLFGCRKIHCFW